MNKILTQSEQETARKIDINHLPHHQGQAIRKALKQLSRRPAAPAAPGRKLRLPAVRHG